MGKKKEGPIPCTLCDRRFTSLPYLQQHVRDKHHVKTPTKELAVKVQPPAAQEPQVQVKNEPSHIPATPPSGTTICDHCLASFSSVTVLRQHKLRFHSWRCAKCPALPPFEDGTAWQTHFHAVHAVTGTKETVATPKKEVEKPSQSFRGGPERSEEGPHSGEINAQHRDASHCIDTEIKNAATQPSLSSLANINQPVIKSPPPEVVAPGATQDEVVSSAEDDKPGFSTSKPTSNSEDRTIHAEEHEFLSSEGPTLSVLVEIESEPHKDRDETTYEIASDTLSPTMTVSSINTDDPEEEYDMSPSRSSEDLPTGSSFKKKKHIVVPPRGPKLGDREGRTTRNRIVTGNNSRHGPNVQTRSDLRGITPSTAKEQYEGGRSDSPTSATSSSQDTGRGSRQGDLPHDPLRTRRSETGSTKPTSEIHFGCRICLSAPTATSGLAATHCGHLFCYECIAAEVLSTSRCPVCKNVLAVYCLFKLDLVS